ncbi:response regulator [Pseudomonas sp. TE3610]
MNSATHIAIVDDYEDIRDLVGQYLRQHGYHVTTCENALSLRQLLEVQPPDLVILDVMMPGEDGLSLCRHLRTHTDIPVIFLSAMTEDLDVILGLELGADDYLAKPFNPRELLARIKAILRRVQRPVEAPAPQVTESIQFGQWTFNRKLRELVGADGISTPLSASEFKLLCVFVDHPEQVLTRDELLEQVAGRQQDYFDRSIDNQVSRLRKKIETDPRQPRHIKTHWGGGYSFSLLDCG